MRRFFSLMVIYLTVTAHSGTIKLEQGWLYHSQIEDKTTGKSAVGLQREFSDARSLYINCRNGRMEISVNFSTDEVETASSLRYAFDEEPAQKTTAYSMSRNTMRIDNQKLTRSLTERMQQSRHLRFEVTLLDGFAERVDIDLAGAGLAVATFLEDCD